MAGIQAHILENTFSLRTHTKKTHVFSSDTPIQENKFSKRTHTREHILENTYYENTYQRTHSREENTVSNRTPFMQSQAY